MPYTWFRVRREFYSIAYPGRVQIVLWLVRRAYRVEGCSPQQAAIPTGEDGGCWPAALAQPRQKTARRIDGDIPLVRVDFGHQLLDEGNQAGYGAVVRSPSARGRITGMTWKGIVVPCGRGGGSHLDVKLLLGRTVQHIPDPAHNLALR